MMLVLMMAVVTASAFPAPPVAPQITIVVHVRRRQEPRWDAWQLNSNVCPPSLCSPLNVPSKETEGGNQTNSAIKRRGTGGSMFYQGDIVLDEEVDRYIFPQRYSSSNHSRSKRASVRLRNRLWKDGEVPYKFSDQLSAQARRVILRAFRHITQLSCITFRQRNESDDHYIHFLSDPGCWSAIGREGGKQELSLGRGCESIGTAVHEIFHSLGVWHEQARKDRDQFVEARKDRDQFVEVLEENVSERFMPDFDKISEEVSTSRGFPYDYTSVMHYSRFAFTRNGKPTLRVIGVGRELGLTLRQRDGLSTIDMAQLRDMYRCNLYFDSQQTSCPDDWFKQETSCYRFFPRAKLSFPDAARKCMDLNSHLVFIESQREDKFLVGHLETEFPSVYTWLTGGLVVNGTMKWYREDSNPVNLSYTNWRGDHPASRPSLALRRNRRTNITRWVGVGVGMGVEGGPSRSPPHSLLPFVCERRARRKCVQQMRPDGRDYRGKLDHTVDGHTCQKWSEHYPHPHNLTDPAAANSIRSEEDRDRVQQDREGLGNHNFCRNPRGLRRGRPWCYTTKKHPEWQLCDVSSCASFSGSG
ncbi:hypothetical protein ACOMHN_007869 [Nucella lapillus]